MDIQQTLSEIKKAVEAATTILIVSHITPSGDSIGSSLAFYLGLKSLGKSVGIMMPDPMTVEFSDFVGADKVKTTGGKRNFIISLNYQEGSIEKVSYNIDGDKFNLVIEPRPGFETFSDKDVSYAYSGVHADLIIAVDTLHLGQLKDIYEKEKELFATKPIINIDRHKGNANYGRINFIDGEAASTAELVALVLSSLGVHLTEDIATNLFNALYSASENFQSPFVNARTFEVASVCMKAGGKRFSKSTGQTVIPTEKPSPLQMPVKEEKQQVPKVHPPEDWLKPKIFKSSNG